MGRVQKLRMVDSTDMTLEKAWDNFFLAGLAKNWKKGTQDSYTIQFKQFNRWYNGRLEDISSHTAVGYSNYLQQEVGIAPVSADTALRHMKAFFNYLHEQGHIKDKVIVKFTGDKGKDKITYTDEEIALMLQQPKKFNEFQDLRTWTIINVFCATGARLGTVREMLVKDVDFQANTVYYRHMKTGKPLTMRLIPQLAQVLRFYLSKWATPAQPNDLLFPSEGMTMLNEKTIYHNIVDYCKKLEIETKPSCHLFRHTFAKNFVKAGGDSLVLQQILGHSTLAMTQHYVGLWGKDIPETADKYNLMGRLAQRKVALKKCYSLI